jgi:hypothetical protein
VKGELGKRQEAYVFAVKGKHLENGGKQIIFYTALTHVRQAYHGSALHSRIYFERLVNVHDEGNVFAVPPFRILFPPTCAAVLQYKRQDSKIS